MEKNRAIMIAAFTRWNFILVIAAIGLIAMSSGSVWHNVVSNLVSVEISRSLVGKRHPGFSALWDKLSGQRDEQSLRQLVILQLSQNSFNAAEETWQQYIAMASQHRIELLAHWITNWSLQMAKNGELSRAEQVMRLLFALDDDTKAYLGLGRLYYDQGQMDKAIQFLEKALSIQPTADVSMQIGSFYEDQGMKLIQTDYHEAMRLLTLASQAFEAAIELNPEISVTASYRLGDIYWKLNRRQEAVNAYLLAAQNGGTGHLAFLSWYYLGNIYALWWNGDLNYELARAYFERAYSIAVTRREQAMSLAGIGITYAGQGKKAEAISVYQHAFSVDPTFELVQKRLEELKNEQ